MQFKRMLMDPFKYEKTLPYSLGLWTVRNGEACCGILLSSFASLPL